MSEEKIKAPRTAMGIDGLDTMIGGGIPKNRIILICGGPGTGKTTIALQFLVNGVLKYGEKGLYVLLDQPLKKSLEEARYYGWDLDNLHQESKIEFLDVSGQIRSTDLIDRSRFPVKKIIELIRDTALKADVKRIAVDSLATLTLHYSDAERSIAILNLFNALDKTGATSLVTNEVRGGSERKVLLEEYLADGVIILQSSQVERGRVRTIEIEKMRGTIVDDQIRPYIISENGVKVISEKDIFSFAAELLTKRMRE
jgi:KaiC/GvpD/RAD55 family RecA-like ATPase